MMRLARWLVIICSVFLTAIYVFVLVDFDSQRQRNRDALRERQATEIMKLLESRIIATKMVLPPGIGSELRQIGQAQDDCLIQNSSCVVEVDSCLDLNYLAGDTKTTSLPSDISYGTMDRTYFAIQQVGAEIIVVKACGAEGEDEIVLQSTFPGLHEPESTEEFLLSTSSARLTYD